MYRFGGKWTEMEHNRRHLARRLRRSDGALFELPGTIVMQKRQERTLIFSSHSDILFIQTVSMAILLFESWNDALEELQHHIGLLRV